MQYRARQSTQAAFQLSSQTEQIRALESAEQCLEKCISLDPTDARAYVSLGKVLQQQKRSREARALYEDAIAVTGRFQGVDVHRKQATMIFLLSSFNVECLTPEAVLLS